MAGQENGVVAGPPPAYQPNTVRGDERMTSARNTTLPLREVMRGGWKLLSAAVHNSTRSRSLLTLSSTWLWAAAIRKQPHIAVTIALGMGWLLGRMHRSL